MIYYRVAFCVEQTPVGNTEPINSHCQALTQQMVWKWRSTLLTSPHALFTLLRAYSYIPKENVRVFFASSEAEMDDMLVRQNAGQISSSVTADQFMSGKRINTMDIKRLEFELNTDADHDEAYTFAMPVSIAERMAWIALLRRRQQGELES
ncbi:hypothetical protein [Dictyobacter aurantiacus]|uniref:Uncharacterized protein n=1 Tax=Dictyobacter aurantiacus TaxID=1936993 RepID=A0A401ZFU9_9CHLR|nr:hypothetical protein [Dictyobacter aurantiacus]GCE05568.1 hypothetical protein KDAU_28970 [Dictyobacter aurantiacus]